MWLSQMRENPDASLNTSSFVLSNLPPRQLFLTFSGVVTATSTGMVFYHSLAVSYKPSFHDTKPALNLCYD